MTEYEEDLLRILSKVGERGISVRALAKHIYNKRTSLFSQPDPEAIHSFVQHYLLYHANKPKGNVVRVRHGYYRLNTRIPYVKQLLIDFSNEEKQKEEEPPAPPRQPDFSLSLFD